MMRKRLSPWRGRQLRERRTLNNAACGDRTEELQTATDSIQSTGGVTVGNRGHSPHWMGNNEKTHTAASITVLGWLSGNVEADGYSGF